MPRDGSGIYTLPYPPVVDGTTIESAVQNGTMSDIALQLNGPVPIVAGGTGANNAHDAMIALSGEIALQIVTNFDSHPFVAGSFSSSNATGQPATGGMSGICYPYADPNFMVIEAVLYNNPSAVGTRYIRHKYTGTWGAWEQQAGSAADLDARYVNVTGDTMTGALNVSKDSTSLKWLLNSNQAFYGTLTSDPGSGQVGIGFLAEKSGVTWKNGSTTLAGSYIASGVGGFPIGCVVNTVGTAEANFAPGATGWVVKTDGSFYVPSSVASTSSATGALTVAGGAGISGALNAGQPSIANTMEFYTGTSAYRIGRSTAEFTDFIHDGTDVRFMTTTATKRLGIGTTDAAPVDIRVGTVNVATFTTVGTVSSSPTTGALTITGGLGVSGAINTPTPTAGDNSTKVATTAFVAGAVAVPRSMQIFKTGSGTYTTPANCKAIKVRQIGGGGGGGAAGNGTAGGTGGTTTFGALTCVGGGGAPGANNIGGGAPAAIPTTGDFNLAGQFGGTAMGAASPASNSGGAGGSGPFGGGGASGTQGGGAIVGAPNTGGGGGGGGGAGGGTIAAGGGASGAYLEKIIVSPAASYSYAIGAGGSAGSGGVGNPGANGGSGVIIVEEYY